MKYINIGALAITGMVVCLVIIRSIDTHQAIQSGASNFQGDTQGTGQSASGVTKIANENIRPAGNSLPKRTGHQLLDLTRAKLNETIARPLFASTRRPFITATKFVPPTRKLVPARSQKASYKLLGVLIGDTNSVALIRDLLKGENIRVSEGDEVQGWRIGQVQRHKISLKKKGEKVMVLNLFYE